MGIFKTDSHSAFGGNRNSESTHSNIYVLNLLGVNGAVLSFLTVEVPTTCAPVLCPRVPAGNLRALRSVQVVDEYM